MFVLWLLACGDKENSTDTGTDTGAETEEEFDTGSETEEETDTGSETEEEDIVGTPVTFDLSDAEGMKIGLLRVQFTDDGIDFDDNKVVTSNLGAITSHTIGIEDPAVEELSVLIPENDTLLGMWAPYLFQDSNGDDIFNEGELIGGIGRTWLVYSTGDISEFNVVEGWSALEMTFTEEPPIQKDLGNVPLDANILENESITIGGSYDTALGDRRIAIAAISTFESGDIETMYDGVATDPWSITLSGVPAENHFLQEDGFQGAMGAAFVYEDVNNSGAFESIDAMSQSAAYTICFDPLNGMAPKPISILYNPTPTNLTDAMSASIYGFGSGWNVMVQTDSDMPYFPKPDEHNNMIIGENCIME
jgi:hypothetical protein